MVDYTRITNNNRMIRNITVHICSWCNQNIVSNLDFAYDHRIRADTDLISYDWRSCAYASVLLITYNIFRTLKK